MGKKPSAAALSNEIHKQAQRQETTEMNRQSTPNCKACTAAMAALLTAVMLQGCARETFHSAKYNLANNNAPSPAAGYGPREGMAYFLPKGYVHVTADLRTDGGARYELKLDVQIMPDAAQMYLLQPKLSTWAQDTFGIQVNSNGLLSSVGSTNVDKSHDVMVSLAGLAGAVAMRTIDPLAPTKMRPEEGLPRHIEVSFAPEWTNASVNMLANVNAALGKGMLKIEAKPLSHGNSTYLSSQTGERQSGPGIFYRPLLPWRIVISDNRDKTNALYDNVVLLPNDAPILSLVPQRTPMVTQETGIEFQNGSPVAFTVDRGSPAAAWAALPLDMIKAFLSVPTEILQLKLNFANSNAALTAKEAENMKSKLELLQRQVELQNLNRANQPRDQ